eukprot:TRINITY_DN4664_c0_g1_i1.p1 TRINITY_DN4664_c0_g1~~TRINITY_DN4664_c0_g1_i1.p1  ORF type:complete len:62 (+),score=9.38 TRINITY_DN4664_c0_g1_i1:226-411(+)
MYVTIRRERTKKFLTKIYWSLFEIRMATFNAIFENVNFDKNNSKNIQERGRSSETAKAHRG